MLVCDAREHGTTLSLEIAHHSLAGPNAMVPKQFSTNFREFSMTNFTRGSSWGEHQTAPEPPAHDV